MKELFVLLKQGNKSALMAAIVNAVIAILRGTAFFFTGNVAMFAETMHAIGDAANQFFVFIGSALSKKTPTKRFPNGFGRLVNLVLLGAVIVVAIMSYETIKEGVHHVLHPTEAEGFFIVVGVLLAGVILESMVLAKAMKEVIHETHVEAKGLGILVQSIKNVGKATPATKLVFMEDLVATGGGLLALLAVLLSKWTGQHVLEGIASVLIGLMMLFVVGKVFIDNAAGVLGEADDEMEKKIGHILIQDPEVKDIRNITVMKEGETLHVEVEVELEASITIEEADVIKERLAGQVMGQKGVADVLIEFSKDDGEVDWKMHYT
ncbi:cation diffusion facilitator family transporter [Bacillus sp. OV322]|uniref:cation diffusion facilitator family transporter n=1 Tax=Bacillus sp. OV322 TaxID=1882764 RepID=UPI0008E51AA7|nr:cation diffusion facilitator family transporter [Bacillus sp. OV322]SFC93875.1 cation diffusion facilitator family transporter [Bacillus sp. OV322]